MEMEGTIVTSINKKRSRKRGGRDDVDKTICEYLKKKARTPGKVKEKQDDIATFLESMAGTIRKLPVCQQAELKFQIHSLVHKAEMECLHSTEMKSSNGTSKNSLSVAQSSPSLDVHQIPAGINNSYFAKRLQVAVTIASTVLDIHNCSRF